MTSSEIASAVDISSLTPNLILGEYHERLGNDDLQDAGFIRYLYSPHRPSNLVFPAQAFKPCMRSLIPVEHGQMGFRIACRSTRTDFLGINMKRFRDQCSGGKLHAWSGLRGLDSALVLGLSREEVVVISSALGTDSSLM